MFVYVPHPSASASAAAQKLYIVCKNEKEAVQINPYCTSETDNTSGRILEDTTNAASAVAAVLYMLQQAKRSWRYYVIKMKRNTICFNTFSPVVHMYLCICSISPIYCGFGC